MIAHPVDASSSAIYDDREGDLARWTEIVSLDPFEYVTLAPIPADSAIGKVGYCDILEASLALVGDSYVFGMRVAGDMPSEGIIPGVNYVLWSFCPQFDPAGSGWDFWNGGDVALIWDGTSYRAVFWDTRTYPTSGEILETPVDFTESGQMLTITVPKELFGVDPYYWFFRVVVLGGQHDFYTFKGGPYIEVDMTDPVHATTPYPGYYYPWLPWPTA